MALPQGRLTATSAFCNSVFGYSLMEADLEPKKPLDSLKHLRRVEPLGGWGSFLGQGFGAQRLLGKSAAR